jgi:hypothetical protein
VDAIMGITRSAGQIFDILRALAKHGINASVDDLIGILIGFPTLAPQIAGSLTNWGLFTATATENVGALTIRIEGR